MFRVLTVEREYGAGGSIIAQKAAEILGWELLDCRLIHAVARAARVDAGSIRAFDEHADSWWRRLHQRGVWAAAITAGSRIDDAECLCTDSVADLSRRVIAVAAVTGDCVIVGRGAQCILQDHEGVFRTFVYRPWRERVVRLGCRATSASDAARRIRSADDERAHYIRTYYGRDWKDPALYHLMINSGNGLVHAARMIVAGVLGNVADAELRHATSAD